MRTLLGIAALALVALAVVIALRLTLVERLLIARLAAVGVSPVALGVTEVHAGSLKLAAVRVGAAENPDLSVTDVDLGWSFGGLRVGQLDRMRLSGVRLRGVVSDAGLSFGSLDGLWAGDGATAEPAVLPARELELDDAKLALETPLGPLSADVKGTVRATSEGVLDGALDLAVRQRETAANGKLLLSGELGAPHFLVTLDALAGQQVAGRVEARGELDTVGGRPPLTLDVTLRNVALEHPYALLRGVSGAVALRGPPFETPEPQRLSIARIDAGVPLTDATLEFTLRPEGTQLRHAAAKFAGGELRADDLTLDAARSEARIAVHGVDLAELLTLVALGGAEGTGRIDGELPIVKNGDELRVTGGELHAAAPGGTLRYHPTPAVAAMAESRPNDLGIATAVLRDFRYDALELRVDGDVLGKLQFALHLRGANPAYRSGQPIELNLNLEAALLDLVRAEQKAYRLPQALGERLRELIEQEKR